jgi:hypothetical protein
VDRGHWFFFFFFFFERFIVLRCTVCVCSYGPTFVVFVYCGYNYISYDSSDTLLIRFKRLQQVSAL